MILHQNYQYQNKYIVYKIQFASKAYKLNFNMFTRSCTIHIKRASSSPQYFAIIDGITLTSHTFMCMIQIT